MFISNTKQLECKFQKKSIKNLVARNVLRIDRLNLFYLKYITKYISFLFFLIYLSILSSKALQKLYLT